MSLKGSPSSRGSVGCGGAGGGGGARGAGGVKARFLIGGSPRFLVESLLFSMTWCDLGDNDLIKYVDVRRLKYQSYIAGEAESQCKSGDLFI